MIDIEDVSANEKDEQYDLINSLVRRGQLGDSEAQTQLLIAYTPLIKSMVKRYVYDWACYEDAMQEGCLVLLTALRCYEPQKGVYFSAYIKRQLFYHFVQKPKEAERHSEKKALSLDSDPGGEVPALKEQLAAPGSSVEEVIGNREADALRARRSESLEPLVECLAPRQRRAIRAHYLEGRRVTDLAAQWGMSENAVSQLLHRGLRRLSCLMKKV
ncbi:sigma-70 family RNA polymerase sigma factor [Eubacterium sp. 1001713B170207_170306_E7]|uniref:RNA polymerase sigma factor n=1 Tax=Eubacterium sp. 1001713B170207_170306_E7 TaxID=2787097 RepID=UPI0018994540|nr:sigma-70 family RNA polymerase sigma factor [Eubacterium sp. 1001713B170207_170306_E7]